MLVSLSLLIMTGIRRNDEHIWRLHMRTADVLTQAWLRAHGPSALLEGSLETNLIHWLCDCHIWTSITRTAVSQDIRHCFSTGSGEASMSGMVLVVHSITLKQRQILQSSRHNPGDSMEQLLEELSDARQRALQYCASLGSRKRSSFEVLIEIFHEATLIYLYQVCMAPDAADSAISLPARRLFEVLGRNTVVEPIAHHMAWPLFIAGTVSMGNAERQAMVDAKLNEIMRLTGVLGRPKLLTFLRERWDRGGGPNRVHWIEAALQCDERGEAITIL
jgi:hypothetical protein